MHQNCKNYTFLVLCSFILKPQSWKECKLKLCEENQGFENHRNTEPIFTFVRFLISQRLVQKYPMRALSFK